MSRTESAATAFELALGIRFQQPALLTQALTHSSYVNEGGAETELGDNERLEFLGDAVLDLIVADLLYRRYPHISAGELTQLRAAMVRMESLASLGQERRLGEFLRIGRGEELSGGRERLSLLCRAYEAVIGAVYLDQGMDAVRELVEAPLLKLLERILDEGLHIDARSALQERLQARLKISPEYQVIGAAGPEHAKEFRVQARIGDAVIGSGSGSSKRAAAQDAARDALQRLAATEAEGLRA